MSEILATNPSSSNPAKTYNIIRGSDDVVYCDCPGWKMRKTCKHLEEFHSSQSAPSSSSLPSRAWIVMEISWQYNDEYYYTGEGDAGTPQKVFFDKKKAEEQALDLNVKALSTQGMTGHYESLGDVLTIDQEDFEKLVKDIGGSVEDYEVNLPKKLSREDAVKVLAAINIRWFEVKIAPVGK